MVLKVKQNIKLRIKNYKRIVNKKIKSYIKKPKGNLNLDSAPIHVLPNNLKYIDGSLDIRFTNISVLPKGLVIKNDLFCRGSNISELPDDIIIGGDLLCINTPLSQKYSAEELENKYNIKGYIYGTKY